MEQIQGSTKYDSIRRYLEQIYLYGFLSREDWISVGTVKDYDKMLTLLRELYPELDESAIWQDRRKYLRFQRTYADSLENRLVNTFLLHTLDHKKLCRLLTMLSFTAAAPRTLQDVAAHMQICYGGDEKAWYNSARRYLQELQDFGYVKPRREKYFNRYERVFTVQRDALDSLEPQEMEALCAYVGFAASVSYPRVVGSYLKRTLERRVGWGSTDTPILLRQHHKRSVFDEDALYQLLTAIHEQKYITAQDTPEQPMERLLPVRVRCDTRLGRWYLLAFRERPCMLRISALKKISLREKAAPAEWETAERKVSKVFRQSLFSSDTTRPEPCVVEAELHFEDAPGMYEQFLRELRIGKVIERDEKRFYHAEINDPLSLVPFLRSFSPWLRICPDEYGIAQQIRENLLRIHTALEAE